MLQKTSLFIFLIFCQAIMIVAQDRKPINLNKCTYLYTGYAAPDSGSVAGGYYGSRVIYVLNDSIHLEMTRLVVNALNGYWDAGIESAEMMVEKTDAMFREYPKFKPKISKNFSDKWELFFRIVDRGHPIGPMGMNTTKEAAANFVFECKVLNGSDGSEIFSRSMEVIFEFGFKPDGCYVLKNIPGLPSTFLDGFNNALKRFFSSNPPPLFISAIKPACLFIDLETASTIKRTFRLVRSGNTLQVTDGPDLGWIPGQIDKEKSSKTKRKGAGIGSGLIALAGVSNTKERTETTKYITRINMEDKSTGVVYGFYIPTEETVSEEVYTTRSRSDGSTSIEKEVGPSTITRKLDGTSHIVRGSDTIGFFKIEKSAPSKRKDYLSQMWDGEDSATINAIPKHWSLEGTYKLMSLKGELYGKEVLFSNSKGGNQLDVWYDNLHVATFKVENNMPREGILYGADIPDEVLKVLGMIASLPYSYYL